MTDLAATLITIAKFLVDIENGLIEPLFNVTYQGQQRLYGKSPEGDANTGKQYHIVYAVVL